MPLPLIFSLLGSGLAGAGALGLSPLLAGSLGAGLGSAIQTGDLEEGLKTGLTAGLLGGIGGALTGGLGAGAGSAATQAATSGAAGAGAGAGAAGSTAATQAAQQAALKGGAMSAVQAPASTGGGGLMSMFKDMPSGMSRVAAPPGGAMSGGIGSMAQRGLQQGVMSGAGLGSAMGAMAGMDPMGGNKLKEDEDADGIPRPEPRPSTRQVLATPEGYRPGFDPEPSYFSPSIFTAGQVARLAGGGKVQYNMPGMGPMYMAAGGLADMGPEAGLPMEAMPQPNEKELVQLAIRAVRNELPEEQAAIVLGQFVQSFGEDALRKLVSDVQSGKADGPRGDVEGPVKGPGDGMDDMVPAAMDDGSQDVLLSNDEFVVPADVVSGLGNGSSEAGSEELYAMMDRVRKERTGKTEQPKPVAAGGLLPA